MRERALNFAKAYKQSAGRGSAGARADIIHPTLFVFLGDGDGAYTRVREMAEGVLRGGAFFARLYGDGDAVKTIRAVKTDIQRNEANLNINRVNISVIISAHSENAFSRAEEAGAALKRIFLEDFPVAHMTLFLLLCESNHWDDYERRSALSMETLLKVSRADLPYNWVFLLSDKNESGVVSETNMLNNYRVICRMPFIFNTESHLEKILRNTGTGGFFVSAGMAQLEKPDEAIAYAVFRHVYQYWLRGLKKGSTSNTADVGEMVGLIADKARYNVDIERDMASVAARNIKARQLSGVTLSEAEGLLYGEGAALFFKANYGAENFYNLENARETVFEYLRGRSAGPYAAAALDGEAVEEDLRALNAQISRNEQDIQSRRASVIRGGLLPPNADTVKRMVADVYRVKYDNERLRFTALAVRAVIDAARGFAKSCAEIQSALERAEADLCAQPDPGHHITEFYKRAVEHIMLELEARYGKGFILERITPPARADDLEKTAETAAAFISEYILAHETMRLSFDEELKRRSQMPPVEYDGEFTHIDEFYRRVLAEADFNAGLSVSLQRYDGLIREKFYFGERDGMLMRYISQRDSVDFINSESVNFLEDASGFMVMRLAGGFCVEDLTRYRAMMDFYQKFKQGKKDD